MIQFVILEQNKHVFVVFVGGPGVTRVSVSDVTRGSSSHILLPPCMSI